MRILIIGGGITGLSAAWKARELYPDAKVTLFEKEGRVGGWIRTSEEGGFFFEKGPRTFQKGRSPHLLKLIRHFGLEIIESASLKRYIYTDGKLRSVGSLIPRFFFSLVKEPFIPSSSLKDESIYDFAARRFGKKMAKVIFDPITLGIYGGDIHSLSIRSCFPTLCQWEEEKGSVIRGFFSAPKKERGLFTLKKGMQTLVDALAKDLDIVLHCKAEKLNEHELYAGGKIWRADRVIVALPPDVPKRSLWVANFAFEQDLLPKKGFGYLVPTQEGSPLLGCVFDSCIFPEQNRNKETRITCMMREGEADPLKEVQKHLGISSKPVYGSSFLAQNAIPQFNVGCGLTASVSVDSCIQRGIQLISIN
jgi:oxygen-dependent protoporphyrinogen oxidase